MIKIEWHIFDLQVDIVGTVAVKQNLQFNFLALNLCVSITWWKLNADGGDEDILATS